MTSIFKNSALNLLGVAIPSLIAIPAMGVLARMLGPEKFSLFMLAFSIVGYASVFDAGLCRAVVRAIAVNDGDRSADKRIMGTATWAVVALSVFACVLLYGLSANLVWFLNVSPNVEQDARSAFELLAFVVPPFLLAITWFAYCEGRQDFFLLNSAKAVIGTLVALLPALALLVEPSLVAAVTGVLVARIFGLFFAYALCRLRLGGVFATFSLHTLGTLLSFGCWTTVSNLISPLMAYADRFMLSNVLGAHRAAYYVAPADAIGKMSIVPFAVARTLFPLFSNLQGGTGAIYSSAYKGLLLATILMVTPTFLFAPTLLDLWLGVPYGRESAGVLRILLVGFFFNSLAQIPFSRIQAQGKSRLTAMIHLAELLPYLAALAVLLHYFGSIGVAIAWSVRVLVDMVILEYFSRRVCVK